MKLGKISGNLNCFKRSGRADLDRRIGRGVWEKTAAEIGNPAYSRQ